MKRCNSCGVEKALTEFHRHSSYNDGHRSQCKVCLNAKAKTPENLAKHLKYVKQWQARNAEKVVQASRADMVKNRTRRIAASAAWRVENRERHRSLVRAWSAANPDASAVHGARRRARKAGGGGCHTVGEWRDRLEYFNHCCAYCLAHESECGPLTKEHVLAISSAGSDDIENIVPACTPCNSRKGPRSLLRFFSLGAQNSSQ
jgi:5-methylcytosine-specific restriction endonuclease McrA